MEYRYRKQNTMTLLEGIDKHLFMPSVNILRNASYMYTIPRANRFIYKRKVTGRTMYNPDDSYTVKNRRVLLLLDDHFGQRKEDQPRKSHV